MGEDVGNRASITPNFDLHSVNRDATQTPCPKEQVTKNVDVDDWSISTRSLVDCSDLDDDVVNTIYCNDWKEAVIGWRPAAPSVKYAWSEPKRHTVDGQGESTKKNRGGVKPQKQHVKEINWRCTVEPGTYRYSPGGFHRKIVEPIPSRHFVNSDERKLLIHLERVRDHFEKTLKGANTPMTFPSWKEKKNDGESNAPQRSSSVGTVQASTVRSDAHSKRRRSKHKFTDDDLAPAKSAEIVEEPESSGYQQESGNHNLQEYQVHKVEINDPFFSLSDDQIHQRRHRLRLTHVREDRREHELANKLTGWGNSSSSVLLNEPDLLLNLNPLQKVTPQQRKIRDDHEFVELRPSRSSDDSIETSSQLPTSDSTFEFSKGSSRGKQMYTVHPTAERYEQLCFRLDTESDGNQSNMDTTSLYSNKDFSLAKELQSVQEILQAQNYLSQQLKKRPDRKRHSKPHRLRALPSSSIRGAGDLPNSGDAGETLHRGIIDRKTASDLATELLPGISGQGLALPLCTNRIV